MRKSEGFEGELIIEIPKIAIAKCEELPLVNSLYIARMGFYPKALHHYYQRPTGISQVILIYCTDGKGWIQFNKERVSIQAGEILLFRPVPRIRTGLIFKIHGQFTGFI